MLEMVEVSNLALTMLEREVTGIETEMRRGRGVIQGET